MRPLSLIVGLVLLSPAAIAQERLPLRVAFVGELQSDRGKDFVQFLRQHCTSVEGVERDTCTPDRLRIADVVLLDWPQQQAVSQWLRDKTAPRHNPLGELSRWDRPTVLIGSAGLNLAADWGLPGTFG